MPDGLCGDWVDASTSSVTPGGVYELSYDVTGLAGELRTPECDEFEFALLQFPDDFTVLSVRDCGPFNLGSATARVIAHKGGPAPQVFRQFLVVPAVGTSDVELRLDRIRLCGSALDHEVRRARSDAEDRRVEIESKTGPSNPVIAFLERIESLSTGAALAAGVALLVVAWPFVRDLGASILEGFTRGGSLSA